MSFLYILYTSLSLCLFTGCSITWMGKYCLRAFFTTLSFASWFSFSFGPWKWTSEPVPNRKLLRLEEWKQVQHIVSKLWRRVPFQEVEVGWAYETWSERGIAFSFKAGEFMTPSCGNVIFFLEDLSEGSNNSIKSCDVCLARTETYLVAPKDLNQCLNTIHALHIIECYWVPIT